MKLLYILYSLLAGALFDMFIAGREKFKARFSAVMHSLGTPVRLMKRFAVTSAASLRKSTEHIKAASRHAAHVTLQKFRVATGGIAEKIRPQFFTRGTITSGIGAGHRERLRIIATVRMTICTGDLKQFCVKTLEQLTTKIRLALYNTRRCISYPKTWWKAVTTIRDEPRRGRVKVFTWVKTGILITVMRLRRCISYPKTWWKSAVTMLYGQSSAAHIRTAAQEKNRPKMNPGHTSVIKPETVRVRPFFAARKSTWRGTRVLADAKKLLFSWLVHFRPGRTQRFNTTNKLSLRQFFSKLQTAGTPLKTLWTGVYICVNSKLKTAGTSIAMFSRLSANRVRVFLHRSSGQKFTAVGRSVLSLSLLSFNIGGTDANARAKQAKLRTKTFLSTWVFPRERGNDLLIKQAYAVTETAKNIIII